MRRHKIQIPAAKSFAKIATVLAPLALITACATDGVYTGGDAGASHFTQIGRANPIGRVHATGPAPGVPAPSSMGDVAEALPGLSVDEARRRVEAYLVQTGFEPESVAHADLYIISGNRMASAMHDGAPKAEAVCALKALERPQMYTTHVDIQLSPAAPGLGRPAASGVRMGIEVKVVELDANLLSGAFSKQTCHSRGVLEAALRRAAVGG